MTKADKVKFNPDLADEDPLAREWLWVLTEAITIHRDRLLILEDEEGDYVPIFKTREAGQNFMNCLDPEGKTDYQGQAMHLYDLRALAVKNSYRLLTLDSQGRIVESWAPPA
ncbi:MAG: hypothetical protein LBP22_11215 [Deltaproteobacteria bacterium]|jgi:hypothetical protein|nr:hypothetical protein [Deltaproteobacteria bacterium]